MNLIHQWQYNGGVQPELLKDEVFLRAKDLGITSLQSYVPWSNIEPREEIFDFSVYDPLVEKIAKHGIGWSPFLILGPSYSIPDWFKKSGESVLSRCLEHGRECGIQSIWNPGLGKRVNVFLKAFHKRYGDGNAVKSVLLGVSGNWGESIYPAHGGFTEEGHMHVGWWCADEYAKEDFKTKMAEKYPDIKDLNSSWKTRYRDFDEIRYPPIKSDFAFIHLLHITGYKLLGWLPNSVKSILKSLLHRPLTVRDDEIDGNLRHWIDFVRWYISAMTKWSDFWLKTARIYFKDTPICLVTGGDGNPMLGADFFAQTKTASQHLAGVRVTNLTDGYAESFFLGRPVSSAARFYGVPFETEEAALHSDSGIAMRIFDAVTSGAEGIYFKNLLGHGYDLCTGEFNRPGALTVCADAFLKNKIYLQKNIPTTDIAFFYPNTSVIIDPFAISVLKDMTALLRELIDFDFTDENMLKDGALDKFRLLILPCMFYTPSDCLEFIKQWVNKGGLLIRLIKDGSDSLSRQGTGYVLDIGKTRFFHKKISNAVCNTEGKYPWKGVHLSKTTGKVFSSRCDDGAYFYNDGNDSATANIDGKEISVPPYSIVRSSLR